MNDSFRHNMRLVSSQRSGIRVYRITRYQISTPPDRRYVRITYSRSVVPAWNSRFYEHCLSRAKYMDLNKDHARQISSRSEAVGSKATFTIEFVNLTSLSPSCVTVSKKGKHTRRMSVIGLLPRRGTGTRRRVAFGYTRLTIIASLKYKLSFGTVTSNTMNVNDDFRRSYL